MRKALITLSYRHVFDVTSKQPFEQKVFNDTYEEFLMQVQAYNPQKKFTTFMQVLSENPKAISLHYKTGFAIGLYVKELNNIIPGLKDSLDRALVPFASYEFQILDSDIKDRSEHKVAIIFTSVTLTLLDSIGEFLLVAAGDHSANTAQGRD